MGEILREQGHAQQALKIHQSLTVRPNLNDDVKIDIHRSLALDFLSFDNFIKAKQEAEFILKIEKKNTWALEFLLNIAERERDWILAAKLAKDIQKIKQQQDPSKLAQFQVFEGLDKLSKDDRNGALHCFQKALEIDPNYGQAHRRLGDFYAENRDLIKAIEHWEQFALLDPDNAGNIFSKIEISRF